MMKIKRIGTMGDSKLSPSGIIHARRRKPIAVVAIEMQHFAMNIKTPPTDETSENFAEFLRIRRKAWTDEMQKDSFEIAM